MFIMNGTIKAMIIKGISIACTDRSGEGGIIISAVCPTNDHRRKGDTAFLTRTDGSTVANLHALSVVLWVVSQGFQTADPKLITDRSMVGANITTASPANCRRIRRTGAPTT